MIALRHILVPTDFSETSAVALKYAKALAENFQATLHFLHVIDEAALSYSWVVPEGVLPPVSDYREQELVQSAQTKLGNLLSETEQKKIPFKAVTRTGSPFVEVIRYAKEKNVDLIVIGTHGRGPIAHMFLGSVAEKVVRKAPCPVLTVRQEEHEFVMP